MSLAQGPSSEEAPIASLLPTPMCTLFQRACQQRALRLRVSTGPPHDCRDTTSSAHWHSAQLTSSRWPSVPNTKARRYVVRREVGAASLSALAGQGFCPPACILPFLAEISWLRGGRKRKWLVCKPTMQKVSTTFWTLSRYFLKLPMPLGHVFSAGVGAATPRAVSPTPAAVRARAGCSARALIPARRPAADAHQA